MVLDHSTQSVLFFNQLHLPSSGLFGLVVILVISVAISCRMNSFQKDQLDKKDKRLQKIVEVLNHLKVIKFQVWESTFEKSVSGLREQELHSMKDFLMLQAFQSFLWNCAIFLVAFLSFSTYSLLGQGRLCAEKAFVSLAIFNNMRNIFRMVPSCISSWCQGIISIKRIDEFLNTKELPVNPKHGAGGSGSAKKDYKYAIMMKECSFTREREELLSHGEQQQSLCLENVNCCVRKGELMGVIGQMGCGKSTFIDAIAGELHKASGSLEINDRVIMVANNPWLKSGTIQENIVFGSGLNQNQYEEVVRACGLLEDFGQFPLGDQTWIHGSGENLSGGQRQRISLARAVYKNGSIYVLDDPLSAVDPQLRQSIFKDVIGKNGILRNKTRITIVNETSLVENMDRIILIEDSTVSDVGTLPELRSRHLLDLEVWKSVSLDNEDDLRDTQALKPKFKRQNTTKDILKSMKTITYDNVEDMAFESVTSTNYLYYLRNLGCLSSMFLLTGYAASQTFEVLSKLWLAAWTSNDPSMADRGDNDFILIYGALGVCQALSFLMSVLQTNQKTIGASSKIHSGIFHNVIYCTIGFIWSNRVGAVANRFSRDMNELDLNLPSTLKSFLFQVRIEIKLGKKFTCGVQKCME